MSSSLTSAVLAGDGFICGLRVYLTGLFADRPTLPTSSGKWEAPQVSIPLSMSLLLRTLALHWNDHFLSSFDLTTDLELMLRVWQTYLLVSLGSYGVILDERHYRDLLMQHVVPPVAKVSIEKLVRSYWNMLTWGLYKNSSLHDLVMPADNKRFISGRHGSCTNTNG